VVEPDWSEEQLAARQALLIEVNSNIASEGLSARGPGAGDWDFVCECGNRDCREQVRLTLEGYEELRAGEGFVLAETHALQRAEAARVWAHSLREEAAALRAQAAHQRRRARRNFSR
jgi:hypothetical protein